MIISGKVGRANNILIFISETFLKSRSTFLKHYSFFKKQPSKSSRK